MIPKKYSLFIGRWQPFHAGHEWLINTRRHEGFNICLAIRDVPTDFKNPWTAEQVKEALEKRFAKEIETGEFKIIIIPDIESINIGRDVGYEVIEHIPPKDIKAVSATKIRNRMVQEGDTNYPDDIRKE